MSPTDQVAWFLRGLSPTLQVECITDYKGSRFSTLADVIAHALCVNRKHEVARNLRSLATPLNAFQTSYPNDDYKRLRRGDYHSNDHNDRGYDRDCDPNNTDCRGYGYNDSPDYYDGTPQTGGDRSYDPSNTGDDDDRDYP